MEENNNLETANLIDNAGEHFVFKRFLIVVCLVVFVACITFSITWYIISNMEKKNAQVNDTLNSNLQSQIDALRSKLNQ